MAHKTYPMEISISIKQEFDVPEDIDIFLGEFIDKIESLDMMFGGGSNIHRGLHNHVVSFNDVKEGENETIVYMKTRDLQRWILNHRFNPVILLWEELSEAEGE